MNDENPAPNDQMKVIVITGSSRGIGFGLAEAFLDRACAVCVSGRSRESTDKAVALLAGKHPAGRILDQPCDVTQPAQVQALWDAAAEHFGRIDIWINNAGLANELSDFRELSPETIAAVVETNVLGTLFGCRVALNGMVEQGFGALYNMEGHGSSGRKQAGLTLYGTSKNALPYLFDCLVDEVEDTPIIVGALRPGMVWTEMISDQFEARPEVWERSKGILNIIMDRVETVAPWLADEILANEKNGARISWLSRRKMAGRFLTAPFSKRQIVE